MSNSERPTGNAALLRAIKDWECPDATAPFFDDALVMDRASGSLIWDVEGREYIDLCSGFGALSLGHGHPALRAVFAAFAADGPSAPILHAMGDVYPGRAKYDLLELLRRHLPPRLTRHAFGLTGSHAVEIALKTMIYGRKEPHILTFQGGYHGVDLGLLPLSRQPFFTAPFTAWGVAGQTHVAPLNGDLNAFEERFFKGEMRGKIAGIIVEPVQGRAGVKPTETAWLQGLAALARAHGALLALDEVYTGFGRAGRLSFADVVPCDLACFGKALGGGMPVSLCAAAEGVFERWSASAGEARHTGTFFGHPLSLQAATATVGFIVGNGLPERARVLGAEALRFLRENLGDATGPGRPVTAIRGEGLMLALEFPTPGAGEEAMHRLRRAGVIALVSGAEGRCLSLSPSLVIENDLLFQGLGKVCEVARLTGGG